MIWQAATSGGTLLLPEYTEQTPLQDAIPEAVAPLFSFERKW